MNVLRSKRAVAGLGAALVSIVGLTLFVVFPAVASSPGGLVPPQSTAGVTPTDVGIGGNATCSNVFPKVNALPNMKTYLNVNPTTGPSSADGTSFGLTLSNPSGGQRLAITSSPAVAIAAVALNGGTDNAAYDYTGLGLLTGGVVSTGWLSGDGNLHAPAKNPSQTYTISHLTICYRLLATISGKVFQDAGSGSATQAGIDLGANNGEIRIFDNTTKKLSDASTLADGTFSSPQPIGDSYTVCAKLPSGYANQSTPSGTSCGSATGYAPAGYTFVLASGGSSSNNFTFQSNSTISGRVYADADQSGSYDTTRGDAALQSWGVNLYKGTNTTPVATATSDANGVYTLTALLQQGSPYTVCEIPVANSGPWAQGIPSPKTGDVCANLGGLPKGYVVPGTASVQTITGEDFANVAAVTCPTDKNANGVDYSVSLDCTKTSQGQTYVQSAGFLNGKPFVRLWAGDQTLGSPAPMIEKITWPYTSTDQNQITVDYTDIYPFDTTKVHAMRFCQKDPSTEVAGWSKGDPLPDGVLQPPTTDPNGVDPESTSCLISTSISVTDGTYVAFIYSAVDGLRNQQ